MISGRTPGLLGGALLLCLAVTACSGDAGPTPTGALCPSDSTLTYDNFGKPFMESYCTRCHHSDLHGSERNGAPLYHDFDSLVGILAVVEHVDEYTAAGPDSVNEIMPPDGATPTEAERTQLGAWLACEVDLLNTATAAP